MIDEHPMLREAIICLCPDLKTLPCKHTKSISMAGMCVYIYIKVMLCGGNAVELGLSWGST